MFMPEEDTPGRKQSRSSAMAVAAALRGRPTAVGSTIRIDGKPLTIIAVAPPGFDYPRGAVLWKAAAFSPGNNGWETIARLKPGIECGRRVPHLTPKWTASRRTAKDRQC